MRQPTRLYKEMQFDILFDGKDVIIYNRSKHKKQL